MQTKIGRERHHPTLSTSCQPDQHQHHGTRTSVISTVMVSAIKRICGIVLAQCVDAGVKCERDCWSLTDEHCKTISTFTRQCLTNNPHAVHPTTNWQNNHHSKEKQRYGGPLNSLQGAGTVDLLNTLLGELAEATWGIFTKNSG